MQGFLGFSLLPSFDYHHHLKFKVLPLVPLFPRISFGVLLLCRASSRHVLEVYEKTRGA